MASEPEKISLEGPHWTFALDFYGMPGVAQACLTLQDKLGVDVIMLLFALFLFRRDGVELNDAELADLDRVIAPWRNDCVIPLRLLRRRIKKGDGAAPQAVIEPLLHRVAQAAILSEQVALAMLAAQPTADRAELSEVASLVDRIIRFYADGSLAQANEEIAGARETIVRAARASV